MIKRRFASSLMVSGCLVCATAGASSVTTVYPGASCRIDSWAAFDNSFVVRSNTPNLQNKGSSELTLSCPIVIDDPSDHRIDYTFLYISRDPAYTYTPCSMYARSFTTAYNIVQSSTMSNVSNTVAHTFTDVEFVVPSTVVITCPVPPNQTILGYRVIEGYY